MLKSFLLILIVTVPTSLFGQVWLHGGQELVVSTATEVYAPICGLASFTVLNVKKGLPASKDTVCRVIAAMVGRLDLRIEMRALSLSCRSPNGTIERFSLGGEVSLGEFRGTLKDFVDVGCRCESGDEIPVDWSGSINWNKLVACRACPLYCTISAPKDTVGVLRLSADPVKIEDIKASDRTGTSGEH